MKFLRRIFLLETLFFLLLVTGATSAQSAQQSGSITFKYYLHDNVDNIQVEIRQEAFGSPIKTLVNESQQRGFYSLIWDGTDNDGRPVASSRYLYAIRLLIQGRTFTKTGTFIYVK